MPDTSLLGICNCDNLAFRGEDEGISAIWDCSLSAENFSRILCSYVGLIIYICCVFCQFLQTQGETISKKPNNERILPLIHKDLLRRQNFIPAIGITTSKAIISNRIRTKNPTKPPTRSGNIALFLGSLAHRTASRIIIALPNAAGISAINNFA